MILRHHDVDINIQPLPLQSPDVVRIIDEIISGLIGLIIQSVVYYKG